MVYSSHVTGIMVSSIW